MWIQNSTEFGCGSRFSSTSSQMLLVSLFFSVTQGFLYQAHRRGTQDAPVLSSTKTTARRF
jgi:hypothetical protein